MLLAPVGSEPLAAAAEFLAGGSAAVVVAEMDKAPVRQMRRRLTDLVDSLDEAGS